MSILIDIQRDYLIEKLKDHIMLSSYFKDYVRLIADTVFGTLILSRNSNADFWSRLATEITNCRFNIHYIKSWTCIFRQLTKLMIEKIYDLKLIPTITSSRDVTRGRPRKGAMSPKSIHTPPTSSSFGTETTSKRDTLIAPAKTLQRALSVDRGKKESLSLSSNVLVLQFLNIGYSQISNFQ